MVLLLSNVKNLEQETPETSAKDKY